MQSVLTKTEGLAAFKEWAVSCEALGTGRQVMLFRKGGISEKGHEFKVEHPNFFLFPTYEHQDNASIKPEFQALLAESLAAKPDLGEVVLKYWANVEEAVPMTSMEPIQRQAANHVWSESCIEYRWTYQASKPLWLLLLRVYKLETPLTLEVMEEYTGCKSWVDLQAPQIKALPCSPVLDDATYQAMAAKVRALL
ncbi:MAG: DUF1802 family protein [candidate division FCPU426 bacterium]